MTCDVAGDRGIQRIAFTRHGRTGHVTVLVAQRTTYVGRPLPIDEVNVAPGKGYRQDVTLDRWNEPVHVKAPAHAVPISQVTSG